MFALPSLNHRKVACSVLTVLAVTCASCISESKKVFKTARVYIKNIRGVNAEPLEWNEYSTKRKIPYNTPVDYIVTENKSYPNYGLVTVIWEGQNYSVYRDAFSYEKDSQYFRVVTKSGLNLRTEPSLKSKVSAIIPFLATGKIAAVGHQTQQIQGRTGFWLQVIHERKTGWIFSGFVITGDSPEQANLENQGVEIRSPELSRIDSAQIKKVIKQVAVPNSKNFVHFRRPDDECSSGSNLKRTGIYFEDSKGHKYGLSGDMEVPVRTNIEAPNLFVTFHTQCICCCPNGSDIIYLQGKNEIIPYFFSLGKYEGRCGPMGAERDVETRISADKTKVMLMVKSPICEGTYAETDNNLNQIKNLEYLKGVFAIFDLSEGTLKKIDTLSVPNAYKDVWSQGFILVGVSPN